MKKSFMERLAAFMALRRADESLEDLEVSEISLSHLTHLFRTNIEWANWGRVIHQDEYRRLHRTHKERLTLPAKERYEQMKIQFLSYI